MSHNHLAFKCTAGAGIQQQKKCNKKNKTCNYNMEEGGRELEDKSRGGADSSTDTREKKGFKKKGCQVKLRHKDKYEKWKS